MFVEYFIKIGTVRFLDTLTQTTLWFFDKILTEELYLSNQITFPQLTTHNNITTLVSWAQPITYGLLTLVIVL